MEESSQEAVDFVPETVLKRDAFSETLMGHAAGAPERKLVLRKLSGLPWRTRWFAWALARREVRGLRAVQGVAGVPVLVRVDRTGILRGWAAGTPLNIARPDDPAWYADARRLLRAMRLRGVTHNDLAKPQNWLMTPAGRAAVIDFQLARVHRRRGWVYRVMAYEDLRHLLKQRYRYAPDQMTPTAMRVLRRRSGPGQIWRKTGKRAYRYVTRRLFDWADGEGTEHVVRREGPAIRAEILALEGVREVALSPVPLPGRGVGLYAFVESDQSERALRRVAPTGKVAFLQAVAALPRSEGAVRSDVLDLIAMNRLDELALLLDREPDLAMVAGAIRDSRLNFSDRVLRGRETG
ncbi:MAG: serine/threonine protein kinase [Pseudomonadota bacterium]